MALVQRSAALQAVFEPVRAASTFEETVERLGTAVRVGILSAGTRLPPERELAEELGISRSTLRQALTTLVESGHFVASRGRGGGTFVASSPPLLEGSPPPGPDGLEAALVYRRAIEIGAVALATERADSDDLAQMSALVDRMAEPGPFEAYRRADMGFHIALAEAAGSPRLVSLMTEVQGEIGGLIALIAHPDTVLSRSNAQHRRLVSALARHDRPLAVRLIGEHMRGTEHILLGLMPRQAAQA